MQAPMLFLLDVANEVGEETYEAQTNGILLFLGGTIVLFVGVVWFSSFLNKFQRELRHLNSRIEQSINERERMHYVRRRRRLWLSILPFVKYHRYSRRTRKRYRQESKNDYE